MSRDGLVTTSEGAELLGFTAQYVRLLARTGQLQAKKIGRDWLIALHSINDLKVKQLTRPLIAERKRGRPSHINNKPNIYVAQGNKKHKDTSDETYQKTKLNSISLDANLHRGATLKNIHSAQTATSNDRKYINKVYFKSSKQMTELPDESIHLIITSPPYFNIKDYSKDGYQEKSIGIALDGQIGDINDYEKYIDELLVVWKECARVMKPNGKLVINVPLMPLLKKQLNTHHNRHIYDINADIEHSITHKTELYLMDIYIWNRTNPSKRLMFGSYPFPRNFYAQNTIEFVTVYVKDGKSPDGILKDIKMRSKLSEREWIDYTKQIWDIPIPGRNDLAYGKHPAIMPEELVKRCIRLFTFESDVVLDPFTGSGTTLKIAKELGRNYVGYELSPEYNEVIEAKLASAKRSS